MAGFKLFGPTQDLLTASLRVRSARHSMLTANIANADTPGYRPRDIDFAGVLRSVVQSPDTPAESPGRITLATTHALHQPQLEFLPAETTNTGEALDRNQVELDEEVTRMVENSLHHEASLMLFSRTLGGLRYAISEGRR